MLIKAKKTLVLITLGLTNSYCKVPQMVIKELSIKKTSSVETINR